MVFGFVFNDVNSFHLELPLVENSLNFFKIVFKMRLCYGLDLLLLSAAFNRSSRDLPLESLFFCHLSIHFSISKT